MVDLIFFAPQNQLSGPLPDFHNTVREIVVNDNQLIGPIPPVYGGYTNLSRLEINDNQMSGCYDYRLYGLCNSTIFTTSDNAKISSGNNFDANWEDFCASGDGFCCTPDLVIDTDPIQSGFYFATNTITIQTAINSGSTVVLDAPVVDIINPAIISLGATVTTNNVGCQ